MSNQYRDALLLELILLLEDSNISMLEVLERVSPRSSSAHEINQGRGDYGEYHTLFPTLRRYEDKFVEYVRMKINTFDYILSKVHDLLMKDWCNLHAQPILPEERLVVTLRFLTLGISYGQLGKSFRMGDSTISSVVQETMNALWETLSPIHMPIPSHEDYLKISSEFHSKWGIPHCLGAVDARHIPIVKPAHSGSMYFNYKGFYSIVLQAVVDANYKYIFIDVGGYGKQNDAATFEASDFGEALSTGQLEIPDDRKLPNSDIFLPFFYIGDGAYPMSRQLIKPYRGNGLLPEQLNFNARLSRARVVVENSFAHTCQKWPILYGTINKTPDVVELIGKCTCTLHNVILDRENDNQAANEIQEETIAADEDIGIFIESGDEIRDELANYFVQN